MYFGNEKQFMEIRKRDMTKDLSWNKSAEQYQRMYAEICDNKEGKTIPFEKAFEKLKKAYIKVDEKNKSRHPELVDENYHRIIQIQFTGRAEGVMYVEFSKGDLHVEPYSYDRADAFVECSYDNLLDMAAGKVSTDKLFLNGQLKISGNLSKGYEMRNLLTPKK